MQNNYYNNNQNHEFEGIEILLVLVLGLAITWLAASEVAALVFGGHKLLPNPGAVFGALFNMRKDYANPASAWPVVDRVDLPSTIPYYASLGILLLPLLFVVAKIGTWIKRSKTCSVSKKELLDAMGKRSTIKKSVRMRGKIAKTKANNINHFGIFLGKGVEHKRKLYGTHEDSYLILGPPRSGKSTSLIIPGVIESPGAVVTTSTRTDVIRATASFRQKVGPVLVFDPQELSKDKSLLRLKWSPITGCEDPNIALRRAKSLISGVDMKSTTNSDFWTSSATTVLRCLLHAAALGGKDVVNLKIWSGSAAQDLPIKILEEHPKACPGWAQELKSNSVSAAKSQTDSVYAVLRVALDFLALPHISEACSPKPDEVFDAKEFLGQSGTIYLLSTPGGQQSIAPLLVCLASDLAEEARLLAAASETGRLDPPLSLWLDEAANIAALPDLPGLLSSGGGDGITTVVVLQSLGQARARWGTDQSDAMWESSTIKMVLPGLSNPQDLSDISRLAGEIEQKTLSTSKGSSGSSTTSSTQRVPALPIEKIRGLKQGHAWLLHRRLAPVEVKLKPWQKRFKH